LFFIIPPPPRSPLFPYTTLFRSGAAQPGLDLGVAVLGLPPLVVQRGQVRGGCLPAVRQRGGQAEQPGPGGAAGGADGDGVLDDADRKSTRLNSSHVSISYAVFCL